jgi:hypothetical protein
MSRSIWILCLLVAAVAGFALGRHGAPSVRRPPDGLDPAGPEFRSPIRVEWWDGGPGPASRFATRCELLPYRIMDGDRCVFDQHDVRRTGGDVWRIELAGGRVLIFAQNRPGE